MFFLKLGYFMIAPMNLGCKYEEQDYKIIS